MAKTSAVEKNKRRRALVAQQANKRAKLKAIIQSRDLPIEDRFKATLKLAEMPRNGSKVRIRNRCEVTGRPRACPIGRPQRHRSPGVRTYCRKTYGHGTTARKMTTRRQEAVYPHVSSSI